MEAKQEMNTELRETLWARIGELRVLWKQLIDVTDEVGRIEHEWVRAVNAASDPKASREVAADIAAPLAERYEAVAKTLERLAK